jgi:hypothetical protein
MILLAAFLSASINVEIDLGTLLGRANKVRSNPAVTCGISTVGYRFTGKPGQQFRYAGETWTVPSEGWIELIAHPRRNTYAINGRSLPLDVWPRDQFGFRDVPLPSPEINEKEN